MVDRQKDLYLLIGPLLAFFLFVILLLFPVASDDTIKIASSIVRAFLRLP
jgi:hypothetical protein